MANINFGNVNNILIPNQIQNIQNIQNNNNIQNIKTSKDIKNSKKIQNEEEIKILENQIKNHIKSSLSKSNCNIFQGILDSIQCHFIKPASNIYELKKNNTKTKGLIFEVFCKLFLKSRGFKEVYLLQELPDEILIKLGLKRQDVGIDIICMDINNCYYAVQCKYRIPPKTKPNVLNWNQLSTFYALCDRTGPYARYIVMTNCLYTRRFGHKDYKDLSICYNTFVNIEREFWMKMADYDVGYSLNDSKESKNKEESKDSNNENKIITKNLDGKKIVLNIKPKENFDSKDSKDSKNIAIGNKLIVKPNIDKLRELRLKFYEKESKN